MKRESKRGVFVIFILILLVLVGYILLALYYREGFSPNTWINGVYCTGKTVEEVNTELLSRMKAPVIIVTGMDGKAYEIPLEEVDYSGDFLLPLQEFRERQNPFCWIDNIVFHKKHTLMPIAAYDGGKLRGLWENLPFVKAERDRTEGLHIRYVEAKGYVLDDNVHERFDLDKAYERLEQVIEKGETAISYEAFAETYDLEMTREEELTWELWKRIEQFQNAGLYYEMPGEALLLQPSVMAKFLAAEDGEIVLDENGRLMLDVNGIKSFVTALAQAYDTRGKERQFVTSKGDTIAVSGGIYGTKLDQKAEVAFLTEYFSEPERKQFSELHHEPVYEQTVETVERNGADGENDIGDTYIEVDMTEQMLYYYEKGELLLETEIVTGNTGRRMGTPAGVNYVYAKQKNRVLRGANYASFVKYWMPVNGNIGIHDASWRSKFGGTIYQTNGSHGCVNLPTDKAGELYEMVEIGTPVVMYYREE